VRPSKQEVSSVGVGGPNYVILPRDKSVGSATARARARARERERERERAQSYGTQETRAFLTCCSFRAVLFPCCLDIRLENRTTCHRGRRSLPTGDFFRDTTSSPDVNVTIRKVDARGGKARSPKCFFFSSGGEESGRNDSHFSNFLFRFYSVSR